MSGTCFLKLSIDQRLKNISSEAKSGEEYHTGFPPQSFGVQSLPPALRFLRTAGISGNLEVGVALTPTSLSSKLRIITLGGRIYGLHNCRSNSVHRNIVHSLCGSIQWLTQLAFCVLFGPGCTSLC
jgi:hypothetical protein